MYGLETSQTLVFNQIGGLEDQERRLEGNSGSSVSGLRATGTEAPLCPHSGIVVSMIAHNYIFHSE